MVIDHTHPFYEMIWNRAGASRYNGAYYYSKEIVSNIIPRVETDYNWVTIRIPNKCFDHSIVFVHNNKVPGLYDYLKPYKDLILVCGIVSTCMKVAHLGRAIHLPLSIDTEEVRRYATKKTKGAAFVGRPNKRKGMTLPDNIDFLEGLPREKLLEEVAKYREVYAVGRCAIEARCLGAKIKPYDPRFPDTSIWRVIDNKEAAEILQKKL